MRRVVHLQIVSQQHPKAARSNLTYFALGLLGAAAATGSTALAEPEVRWNVMWSVVPAFAPSC